MCFHLCKPLICYLFITTNFQIIVDFMTQWNGGFKSLFFLVLNFLLCVSVSMTQLIIKLRWPIREIQTCFFHPNLWSDSETSSILFLLFSLIRLGCWSQLEVLMQTAFSPIIFPQKSTHCVILCVSVFRQQIDSGEVVGGGSWALSH